MKQIKVLYYGNFAFPEITEIGVSKEGNNIFWDMQGKKHRYSTSFGIYTENYTEAKKAIINYTEEKIKEHKTKIQFYEEKLNKIRGNLKDTKEIHIQKPLKKSKKLLKKT